MRTTLQSQIRWCARIQWALAGTLCAFVIAFYVFAYRPHSAMQAQLHRQIRQAEDELLAAKSQTRILPDVASEVQQLRVRLERSKKSIPKQQELAQFIRDVTQLSQQAQLKVNYKPGAASRSELVSELPIQFELEGDFVSIYAFLRNAEDMPRLTRVRGMRMKSKNKGSGQVQVELSMNIYFASAD